MRTLSLRARALRLAAPLAALFAAAAVIATLSLTHAQMSNGVYDADGDNLIEVTYLEQLDAIRYDSDGNGSADVSSDDAAYAAAFPVAEGQAVCGSGCNGYELSNSLDFDAASSYRSGVVSTAWTDAAGSGWTPIIHRQATGAAAAKGYKAIFEGNGHTIANLYTKRTSDDRNAGLFDFLESAASIRSLGLTGVDIVGGYANSGALVGNNKGAVTGVYAVGAVSGKGNVGGLVGNNTGSITTSYFSGSVTSAENYAGGLVGDNIGTITHSYATGAVTGAKDYVGGLAGYNLGAITHSYASGTVAGGEGYAGGLLGKNGSTVASSFADGAVSGVADYVGGLVGDNIGTVKVSYAAGAVSGAADYVGGLIGDNGKGGVVRSAYAIGNVSGNASVGGLIGSNAATVAYSFAAGCSVTGSASVGGLVGSNAADGTTVTASYWDVTIGPSASAAGTGKTTAELQTPTNYTGIYAAWSSGAEGDVWDFGTGSEYPALEADLNVDGTASVGEFGRQRWQTGCSGSATGAPTPTPTPSSTPTPMPTPSGTPTATPTPTVTPTPTPSGTPTATPTPTVTPTPAPCQGYNLCLESVTAGDASLTFTWKWTRPDDFHDYPSRGFVYFEFEQKNAQSQWVPFYYLDANDVVQRHLVTDESATTYTLTGLNNGQTYDVRMSGHYYKPSGEGFDFVGSNTGFQVTPTP